MKIPLHSIIGPVLKNNRDCIKNFCEHPVLSLSPFYVGVLGVLGMFQILSLFDILRIIHCGPVLPGFLWREGCRRNKLISPETERDFKLICLVWSLQYYALLLVGLLTSSPIFFIPFLLLYAVIVCLECIIFVVRLFTDGIVFSKTSLVMSMFMIYNWLSVFCTFVGTTTRCDL